jgi:hypothetical protein
VKRAAAIAALAAAAALAPAAAYASSSQIPVTASGAVSVDFHGDRAAGCEQTGLCDVSGTETWDPGRSAQLEVLGKPQPQGGFLFFDAGAQGESSNTTARARRTAPDGSVHTCSDVAADRGGGELRASGGLLAVGLGALLGTRCPGPVDADVAGLLPTAKLTAAQLATGQTTLDLSGERSFASHGLAGTVRSTVVLTLGKPQREQDGAPSRHGRRYQFATAEYAIESVSGRIGLTFGGLSQPELCDALDACDLTGTIDMSLDARGGHATLVAFGSGRLSRRQMLEKLGIARRGRSARRLAVGSGHWAGGGTVVTTLNRAAAPGCHDEAQLPGGALQLAEHGPRLTVSYLTGLDTTSEGLPLRCGGPDAGDVAATSSPASGSVPSSVLRRRRFAVRLRRGGSFAGAGYQGSSTADLTVVLRRRRVSIRPFRFPTPSESGSFVIVDEIVRSAYERTVAR